MKTKVVYYSKTGSTRKIAEAIAEESGTIAQVAENCRIDETIDLLFVGGAIYATYDHDFHPSIKKFIMGIDKKNVRRVAAFGTYAFGSSINKLISIFKSAGLPVVEESYVCKGRFLFFNFRHPNKDDILRAKEFAKKLSKNS